jgi:hypothetical protein
MGVRQLNFELSSEAYPTFDVNTVRSHVSDLNLIARDLDQYHRELLMFRHHVHVIDQKCKDNQRIEDVQLHMLMELQILSNMELKVTMSGLHTTPPIMFDDTSSPGFVAYSQASSIRERKTETPTRLTHQRHLLLPF